MKTNASTPLSRAHQWHITANLVSSLLLSVLLCIGCYKGKLKREPIAVWVQKFVPCGGVPCLHGEPGEWLEVDASEAIYIKIYSVNEYFPENLEYAEPEMSIEIFKGNDLIYRGQDGSSDGNYMNFGSFYYSWWQFRVPHDFATIFIYESEHITNLGTYDRCIIDYYDPNASDIQIGLFSRTSIQ